VALRVVKRFGVRRGGVEAAVDIAGEHPDGGPLGSLRELLEALMIGGGERVRDVHDLAQTLRAKAGGGTGEPLGFGSKEGSGRRFVERGLEVERLGRRNEDQHRLRRLPASAAQFNCGSVARGKLRRGIPRHSRAIKAAFSFLFRDLKRPVFPGEA
jgi:hypothetical protein